MVYFYRYFVIAMLGVGIWGCGVYPSAWMIPEGEIAHHWALSAGQITGYYIEKSRVNLADIPGFSESAIGVSAVHYQGEWGAASTRSVKWRTGWVVQSGFAYQGNAIPNRTYLADTQVSMQQQFFGGLVSGATEIGIGLPGTYLPDTFSFEGRRDFEVFVNILIAKADLNGFSTGLDFGHHWRLGPVPNAIGLTYYAAQTMGTDWRIYGIFDYVLDLEGSAVPISELSRAVDAYWPIRQIQDRLVIGIEKTTDEWGWGIQYATVFSGENTPAGAAISLTVRLVPAL